jgi:hypothetical protein
LEKVTCRLVVFSILSITIFPLPISFLHSTDLERERGERDETCWLCQSLLKPLKVGRRRRHYPIGWRPPYLSNPLDLYEEEPAVPYHLLRFGCSLEVLVLAFP